MEAGLPLEIADGVPRRAEIRDIAAFIQHEEPVKFPERLNARLMNRQNNRDLGCLAERFQRLNDGVRVGR